MPVASTAITYAAVVSDVSRQLSGVAPSFRSAANKGINSAPPRYVWLWLGVINEEKKGFNPTTSKTLGDELHRALVEIWARTEEDAMAMRRALLTAGRNSLGYDRFRMGDGDVTEQWTDTSGLKLEVQISIRLPAVDTFLPPITPAAGPGASPSAVVQDATYPLQPLVDVIDDTPAVSPPGDGILEFTEP